MIDAPNLDMKRHLCTALGQSGTSAQSKSNREDSSESEVIVGVNYFPLNTGSNA